MSAPNVLTDPDWIKECIVGAIKDRSQTLTELGRQTQLSGIGKSILAQCLNELVNQEKVLEQDKEGVIHYVEPKK